MLAQATSPSADLYFAFSMSADLKNGTATQLTPTVFLLDDTLVVVRHLSGLRRWPSAKRLIYVIDDDWRAGLRDAALPFGYRAKLALREARQARHLERRADVILCGSEFLRERLQLRWPNKTVRLLEPAWPRARSPLPAERPKRVAYLSAATHRADFEFIEPILDTALSEFQVHLTVTANAPLPSSWTNRPGITIVPVMTWRSYRNWMVTENFDIGLYPTCDTPFNAARSSNKLLEYDQFGAALICSSSWHAGSAAAKEGRCITCPDHQADWQNALRILVENLGEANSIASANRRALAREDPLISQRKSWFEILERDLPLSTG